MVTGKPHFLDRKFSIALFKGFRYIKYRGRGVVVSMVVGFLWHSPMLFGKMLMKLSGMTKEDMEKSKKDMPKR